jgi:hemolysin activation/secretion protein
MRHFRFITIHFCIYWVASISAYCQNLPNAGALQQQLERQIPSLQNLPSAGPSAPLPQSTPSKDEEKIEITDFRLNGRTLIPQEDLDRVLQPWRNRSLSLNQIQDVANAISNAYRLRDYVAQVLVPEQKIENGIVELQIIEVKLGRIKVDNEGPNQDNPRFGNQLASEYLLERNQENSPLRVDQLQRAIMIVSETPGANLTGTLEPGEKEGTSDFRTQLRDTKFVTGRAEVSTFGSRSTGITQTIGSINLNNISGNGDIFSLNGIASQGSSYGQAQYQVPVGRDGWRVGATASYLDYQTVGQFSAFGSRGNAYNYGLNVYYPLVRGVQANSNFVAGYDNKNYLNLTSDPYSVIGRYKLNNFYMGLTGNYFDVLGEGALTYWSVTGTTGHLTIDDFNQNQSDQAGANTNGFFKKLVFNYNRYQNIEPNISTLLFSLSGQMADTNLNSAEQFYLGGPYGIRAYPVSQAGGSGGLLFTLEYQHKLPVHNTALIAFFDMGRIKQYINLYDGWQGLTNASNYYNLYGAGFGFKWAKDNYQFNASLAFPIGNNPLYTNSGAQVNADNRQTNPQGWVQGIIYF